MPIHEWTFSTWLTFYLGVGASIGLYGLGTKLADGMKGYTKVVFFIAVCLFWFPLAFFGVVRSLISK